MLEGKVQIRLDWFFSTVFVVAVFYGWTLQALHSVCSTTVEKEWLTFFCKLGPSTSFVAPPKLQPANTNSRAIDQAYALGQTHLSAVPSTPFI